ncbi:MAG: fimbrillin family protein [Bacteroidales bacterium]|nr:fimbrillin family protein [Bacteroidales bacterium]
MKKYCFIALAVTGMAALSVACSKSGLQKEPFADAPWAVDKTLPVPISFGANGLFDIATKGAPIYKEGDAPNWNGTTLSIFGAQMDPNLTCSATLFTDPRVLLDRVSAKVDSKVDREDVVFTSGNNVIHRYYPMVSGSTNRYNYSFVGYHAPSPTGVGNDEAGNPYVNFNLAPSPATNNEDILWARTNAIPFTFDNGSGAGEVTYNGFNADYIRNAYNKWMDPESPEYDQAEYEAHLPKLSFTHQAAMLRFKIKAADARALSTFWDGGVGTGTPILQVGNSFKVAVRQPVARLNLATGELTPANTTVVATEYDYTAAPVTPVDYSEGTDYGTGLFVIPGTRVAGTYDERGQLTNASEVTAPAIRFTYTNNRSGEVVSVPTEDLPPLELKVPEGGYVAGKIYTYYITVMSIEEILISAVLSQEWEEGVFDNTGDNVIPIG